MIDKTTEVWVKFHDAIPKLSHKDFRKIWNMPWNKELSDADIKEIEKILKRYK